MIRQLKSFSYKPDDGGPSITINSGTEAELLDTKLDNNYTSGVAVQMRIFLDEQTIVDWIDSGLIIC